jgi:hypothetical protein
VPLGLNQSSFIAMALSALPAGAGRVFLAEIVGNTAVAQLVARLSLRHKNPWQRHARLALGRDDPASTDAISA